METANTKTWTPTCQTCNDEQGYLVRDENGEEKWRICEMCRISRRADRIMGQSKITPEFKTKLFKNFEFEKMPSIVKDAHYAAGNYARKYPEIKRTRRNSMALLGMPGSGKTHLCMAISNHLIRTGEPLIYFPWVEGFNELKDNLNELEERVGLLQKVNVLYIDDMWKGRKVPTDFQIEQAFAIINYRYMNNLPVIVSSEFDVDAMCKFDMAIGSRIYEMCKDFCVVIQGDYKEINYRLREDEPA